MKNLLFITFFLIGMSFASKGQGFSPSATYGHTAFAWTQYTTISSSPYVVKNNGFDTLVAGTSSDTGYMQYSFPYPYYSVVDIFVKYISGTLAGTAVLMGSNSNAMPSPTSTSWHILTGSTTYCSGCAGASATVSGTGTTSYEYHLPREGSDYKNYQVRVILTGTCSATYTAVVGRKN